MIFIHIFLHICIILIRYFSVHFNDFDTVSFVFRIYNFFYNVAYKFENSDHDTSFSFTSETDESNGNGVD